MRESVSYTVTLNFVITFIIIVFAFLSATLIFFKSNKVGNIIVNAIEKYEGYNSKSEEVIYNSLKAIGYNMANLGCNDVVYDKKNSNKQCTLVTGNGTQHGNGDRGYCIYLCEEYTAETDCKEEDCYYYYRVRTNMVINMPLVSNIWPIPVFSNTNRLYDFESKFK